MKTLWTVIGKDAAFGVYFSRSAARASAKRMGVGFRVVPIKPVR